MPHAQPHGPTDIPQSALAGGIEVAPAVFAPESALRFGYARSSGPGGQNVNKLNTKVELWVAVESLAGLNSPARQRLRSLAGRQLTVADEIHIQAQTSRTQEANRRDALSRLRRMIVEAMRAPKTRRKTRPTAGSVRRRLTEKRRRGEVKQQRNRPEP